MYLQGPIWDPSWPIEPIMTHRGNDHIGPRNDQTQFVHDQTDIGSDQIDFGYDHIWVARASKSYVQQG
jgi:hypothetical protein